MKTDRHIVRFTLLVVVCLCATTGCGPGNVIAKRPTIDDVDDQTATCKVAKDPLNPLIVEWPAQSKATLEGVSQRGVVMVSYAGCTLKVLTGCTATGKYGYQKVTPARDTIKIRNEDELYARLPLGAANLKGELAQSGQLELDLVAVGQRYAAEGPMETSGPQCNTATHYVRTITVGAYALTSGAQGKASLQGGVGDIGGGVGREESDVQSKGSGSVSVCVSSAPTDQETADNSGCGAILQLDLAPLQRSAQGDVLKNDFGKDLSLLSTGPSEYSGLENISATSLADVDADYLELLQNAKKTDKNPDLRPQAKADAWGRLASYVGKKANPAKEVAFERQKEWLKAAEDLEKLKQRYLADKTTIEKLRRLDDDIVKPEEKTRYEQQFEEAYSPWEDQLKLVLGGSDIASDTSGSSSSISSYAIEDQTVVFEAEGGLAKLNLADAKINPSDSEDDIANRSNWFAGLTLAFPNALEKLVGLILNFRYGQTFSGDSELRTGESIVTAGGGLRVTGPLTDNGLLELRFAVTGNYAGNLDRSFHGGYGALNLGMNLHFIPALSIGLFGDLTVGAFEGQASGFGFLLGSNLALHL